MNSIKKLAHLAMVITCAMFGAATFAAEDKRWSPDMFMFALLDNKQSPQTSRSNSPTDSNSSPRNAASSSTSNTVRKKDKENKELQQILFARAIATNKNIEDRIKNIDVNFANPVDGTTPIMLAAQYGNVDAAKLLIARKADPFKKNHKGVDALELAFRHGHTLLWKMFLSNVINNMHLPTADSDASATKLTAFIHTMRPDNARRFHLMNVITELIRDNDIINACQTNKLERLQEILTKTNINATIYDGTNGLMAAIDAQNLDIAEYLIEKGIQVNAQDEDGATALLKATFRGYKDLVEKLITAGARDIPTKNNSTALSMTTHDDRADIAEILINRTKCNINAQCKNGYSTLIMASKINSIDVARVLIKHGADLNVRNKHGKTALMVANTCGSTDIVKLILKTAQIPRYLDHKYLMSLVANNNIATLDIALQTLSEDICPIQLQDTIDSVAQEAQKQKKPALVTLLKKHYHATVTKPAPKAPIILADQLQAERDATQSDETKTDEPTAQPGSPSKRKKNKFMDLNLSEKEDVSVKLNKATLFKNLSDKEIVDLFPSKKIDDIKALIWSALQEPVPGSIEDQPGCSTYELQVVCATTTLQLIFERENNTLLKACAIKDSQ